MGGLLRKAVASIRKGSLHNNDRSILFNIAQLRKMKEKAVGRGAYVLANNRAEGNALPLRKSSPLTVQELLTILQGWGGALG